MANPRMMIYLTNGLIVNYYEGSEKNKGTKIEIIEAWISHVFKPNEWTRRTYVTFDVKDIIITSKI